MVLDAGFLPNPSYVVELRSSPARTPGAGVLLKSDMFSTFMALTENWVLSASPVQQKGRANPNIAMGCAGRVALVEILAQRLRREIPELVVVHRD